MFGGEMTETLNMPLQVPIAVVGGGLTGMAAALAFGRAGMRVALIVKPGAPPPDLRTAALFPGSVQLLRNLNVWAGCEAEATALAAIRIVDDTGWLLRAPETLFRAADMGLSALAWNTANSAIGRALEAGVAGCLDILRIETAATPVYSYADGGLYIRLAEGQEIAACLVIAADGRESPLRTFAGITVERHEHDQTALVTTFAHSRPHLNISTEIHRQAGPLTTVPMPGNRSSLVWVERPREVARLLALDDAAFTGELQQRLHGSLGQLSGLTPRMTFRLQDMTTQAFARDRIALVGEAAHVLPPIGAQGLNLGLRDVADLAEAVLAAGDPGSADVLVAYDRVRRRDAAIRSRTVSALNTSLSSGALSLQLARGLGLHTLNAIPALKRMVMQQGATGSAPLPRLMRTG